MEMSQISIVKLCRELGCCDACCVRYLGIKNPSAYENVQQFVQACLVKETNSYSKKCENDEHPVKNTLTETEDIIGSVKPTDVSTIPAAGSSDPAGVSTVQADISTVQTDVTSDLTNVITASSTVEDDRVDSSGTLQDRSNSAVDTSDSVDVPPAKRMKMDDICVSCLGILQEDTWPEAFTMVQDVLEKKRYECDSIAVALSAPLAALPRERAVALRLRQACAGYDPQAVMPLKEAWKWVFGRRLAAAVGKRLQSGATAPLLLTLHLEYADDAQELAAAGAGGAATRRGVERALAARGAGPGGPLPAPRAPARAVAAGAAGAALHVAGRYVKRSRALPQTPWLVAGRRVMHSSVQEIIFAPVAQAYGLSPEEGEQRLKFISAGREDVDVRCLGTGRPFALEIADPRRVPSEAELRHACDLISAEGKVLVRSLVPITRAELAQLKAGEQSKSKTYSLLCVKLGGDVTAGDVARLNAYRNTAPGDAARVRLAQRTPLRVLHRRALADRRRALLALSARSVPRHPRLLLLRVRAEAGTYVKEWAHGELRRTRPALADALGAPADILALDVAHVDLPWPPAARTALPTVPTLPPTEASTAHSLHTN